MSLSCVPFLSCLSTPGVWLVAHDCCEIVLVTLCSVRRGIPEAPEGQKPSLGLVAPLAEDRFSFVQDLAFDMAQFLVKKKQIIIIIMIYLSIYLHSNVYKA